MNGKTTINEEVFVELAKTAMTKVVGVFPETDAKSSLASFAKLLAERLNVKESEVVEMSQRMDNWDVSLEAPVRNDSEDEQKSFLPSDGPGIEEMVASQQMRERLGEVLAAIDDKLNEKERMILQARLLTDEPKTLQTIADEFGISRERVRQIEANLLKKLRRQLEKDLPDIQDFLDGDAIVAAAGPAGRDE